MSDFTYETENRMNKYETYEWDDMWIDHANETDRKRAAYIGDSISVGTRRIATARTNEEILFDGFGTSKALDNPYFKDSIRLFLNQVPNIDTVLFNNGLHGWHLNDETEYKTLYDEMIQFILSEIKDAKLYILLTTAVIDKDDNDRVKLRNIAAREVAEKYSIPVIDLYDITSANISEISPDGIHPTEPLYEKIADEIIRNIR
ncbi:MAG: SGNH/GDSL hydrolase family protein [Eubacteriales bacterium]|nr:SGNH/GDSL hydrolase family protein [Eubacteriales bacterium]MDY4212545.1 SGNH/GDSL hydrolase family protein [Eubacteriales bacterium]